MSTMFLRQREPKSCRAWMSLRTLWRGWPPGGTTSSSPPSRLRCNPTPFILHQTPYSIHHTPYTLHYTSYALHSTPRTIHPTSYNLNHTPYNRDPAPHSPYTAWGNHVLLASIPLQVRFQAKKEHVQMFKQLSPRIQGHDLALEARIWP